jgi:hypothetical protein
MDLAGELFKSMFLVLTAGMALLSFYESSNYSVLQNNDNMPRGNSGESSFVKNADLELSEFVVD